MKKNIFFKSLKHKEGYNIRIGEEKYRTLFTFLHQVRRDFYHVSYSVHVCISHYLYMFKIAVSRAAKPVAPVAQRMKNPVWPSSCVTPAGTSNELDVQNEWEENTHTHTHTHTHTPQLPLIPPWENQCEWHRMTRMTGPDCADMCNLINTHTHKHTRRVCWTARTMGGSVGNPA